MDEPIDPAGIEIVVVDVSRAMDGGVDVLRQFVAAIDYANEDGDQRTGSVQGGSVGALPTLTSCAT